MTLRQPYRPRHEVTQSYNDGIVTICTITDIAQPGYKPKEGLQPRVKLRYEERRVGIQRYYAGKENQSDIQRVIRTQRAGDVSNQDAAVTENGVQYRIEQVQAVLDVYPPSQDITLRRIEQRYEVTG